MSPKLSVIIPVYNAGDYLRQCLDSVLTQSLADIEVICVDDGSSDGSLEILKEYHKKDARVKVLHQHNQYAGVARNNGLSVAAGEYVAFLDADDYVLDYAYESLYLRAKQNRLDWIKCRSIPFDVERDVSVEKPIYLFGSVQPWDFHRLLTQEDGDAAYHISVVPWNGIYRRAFLEEHQIRFNSLICINDRSFYWRVLTNAKRFMLARDYLVVHRVEQKGSLVGKRARYFDCQFQSFEITARQLVEDGIAGEKAKRVIRSEVSDLRTWYQRFCSDLEYGKEIQRKTQAFLDGYGGPYGEVLRESFWNYMASAGKTQRQASLPEFHFFHEACENPKVTVVIPVYNVQDYLHECLDSVCGQTMEELEIICVDDGSTDASEIILREYAAADRRIRIITQQNRYAGAARNVGIRAARGEYLLFLDSDDFFDKELCELTYGQARAQDADLVLFGARNYEMSSQSFVENSSYFRRKLLPPLEVFSGNDVSDVLFLLTTPNPWLRLFRREFVLREGIFFQEIRHSNDIYFSIVTMAAAGRITYVDRDLVNYRKGRMESLQNTKDDNPTLFLDAYDAARAELTRRGLYEKLKKGFVERFYASCAHNLNTVNTNDAWRKICLRMFESEMMESIPDAPEEYQSPDTIRRLRLAAKIMECCDARESGTADMQGIYAYVSEELRADRAEFGKKARQLHDANRKVSRQEQELDDIKESASFRIGRTITWLPRKMRNLLRHG